MKNKKMLAVVLVLSMMCGLVACGNTEGKKANTEKKAETTVENESEVVVEDKTETQQPENVEVNQPEEQPEEQMVEQKTEQKTEQKAQQQSTTTKKESASNSQTTASTPVNNQPQLSTTTHEHVWKLESKSFDYFKTYVNGCNGCGYPLFTITENGTQHIENLYFHPACYSEKLGGDCTGGGFHNESYTSGYCTFCGGKVSYRQCMWTEMGKRCAKNEALGAYKKVTFDQNHFMYLDVCDCGKNWIVLGEENNKCLVDIKEVCTICGAVKE